jgi:hypothetical protein
MKFKPKSVLIVFGFIVFLFIFFSSVAVHEFVHFAMDGFAGDRICFLGYNEMIGAPFHIIGWYDSSTDSSEFLPYLIQGIFAVGLVIVGLKMFWRVYDKL